MVICKLSGAFSKVLPKFNCEVLTVSVCGKHSIEKKISGIGINNVKHRLKLFYGTHNFELKIDNKETYYKLYLKINLT